MKLHANAPLVGSRTARNGCAARRRRGRAARSQLGPKRVHNATALERVEAIAALRRLRLTGPEIAETLEMTTSTVSAVFEADRLGEFSRLDPEQAVRRYERHRPGELIHIVVKKLGRIGPFGVGHRALGRRWARRPSPTQRGVRRVGQAGVRARLG